MRRCNRAKFMATAVASFQLAGSSRIKSPIGESVSK